MMPIIIRSTIKVNQLLLLLLFVVFACGTRAEGQISLQTEPVKSVRILVIGNSFTGDAFFYAPFIINAVAPQAQVEMGILYRSGCSLKQHYDDGVGSGYIYDYFECNSREKAWRTSRSSLPTAIAMKEWDIVVFQQASGQSPDYRYYRPALDHLISWVDVHLVTPHIFGWLITPAYADGYGNLKGMSSDEMATKIANCAARLKEEMPINIFFPCGTAIQYARHSSITNCGNFGSFTSDGSHLQDGLPRLIESYVVAGVLLKHLNLPPDLILKDNTAITDAWIAEHGIPQRHGRVVGMSVWNCSIARECALRAIRNPFVTNNVWN